ncbi:unnamed protein product [Larinioides sclopetarius]|uniref:Uncharacterized protein n=1 Tax=Larinioides sclopetarius TaxID=280406 RepID=A0AAV1ZNH9_9ARAC
MDFSSRLMDHHVMIPPESIKKEILEECSQEALLSIQKVPSLSDLSKENSLGTDAGPSTMEPLTLHSLTLNCPPGHDLPQP